MNWLADHGKNLVLTGNEKKIQSFMTAVCSPMLGTEREREMKTQTEPVCQPLDKNVDMVAPVLISNHIWVKIFTVISGKSQILWYQMYTGHRVEGPSLRFLIFQGKLKHYRELWDSFIFA